MSPNLHHFWTGVGSALRLWPETNVSGGFYYKGREIGSLTAAEALRQDWELVGKSISGAVNSLGEAQTTPSAPRKRSRPRRYYR